MASSCGSGITGYVADVRTVAELEQWFPLADLSSSTSPGSARASS